MSFARTLATPALRGTTEEQLAAARAKRSALVEKLKQAKGGPAEYTYESLVEQNDRYVAELEKMIGQSRPDDLLRRIAELESLLAGCDRTRSDAVEAMRRERDGLQRMNEEAQGTDPKPGRKRLNQLEKLKDRLPDENVSAQIAKTQKNLSELLAQHDLQVVELEPDDPGPSTPCEFRLETDILRKQNELAAARKQTDELNRTIAELARKAQTSGDEIRAKETAIAELKEGFEQARKSLSEVTAAHSEELRELAAMRQTQASLLAERQALAAKIQECGAYVQSSQTASRLRRKKSRSSNETGRRWRTTHDSWRNRRKVWRESGRSFRPS
jgi:chromosome segregation ATPase